MSALDSNMQTEIISLQLKAIELINVTLNHPGYLLQESVTFHYDLKIDHKINITTKTIFVVIDIEILNENKDFILGSVKVNCIFGIENLLDFVDSDNEVNLPDQAVAILNSITISTARGIMFSQFKGTFLHHAYLPVIDPKSYTP